MPPIYINTDNSNKNSKIYVADLVGPAVAEAEAKMQSIVVKAFEKESEFTTNKIDNAKGYTLTFKVTKYAASGRDASCTITGDIVRFPAVTYSKAKGAGATQDEKVMFGGTWSASASASGRTAAADCIEAVMEALVPKSFPVMKSDMARR